MTMAVPPPTGLARVLLFAITAYAVLVFLLRVSGKRTLAQMDPFDFVIATALGSTLAQTILAPAVTLGMGIVAFAVLIGLQWVTTLLTVRFRFVQRLVKPDPRLLYFRGVFLERAMRDEHVAEVEIRAAIRAEGYASLDDVEAVVLEADGRFSVLAPTRHPENALEDV
jgi:uncharacterized membrane protein YcaP (DUF421 family)